MKKSILVILIILIAFIGVLSLFGNMFLVLASGCLSSCKGCWCEGNVYKCEIEVRGCCRYNQTTGLCEETGIIRCDLREENCDAYDKWICGCAIGGVAYRSDKYRCFENWYCTRYGCSYRYESPIYCGRSEDTDGGDKPETKGIATDRYCSNGVCQESTYIDMCQGICSRSELIEYYVNNDRVTSKTYPNLFSKNQYCKDGAIYVDLNKPNPILSPSSYGWTRNNIGVTLICSDSDESGCYKYNYNVVRVI